MGPENTPPESFTLFYNGEPIAIRPGGNIFPEITLAPNDGTAQDAGQIVDASFTATATVAIIEVKPGKEWRRSSRKRFIKILMGHGLTRNQAAEFASAVILHHRCNMPRKYRLTYQGLLIRLMIDRTYTT